MSVFLAPKLGDGLALKIQAGMIMQLNLLNVTALMLAVRKLDIGFAAVPNMMLERHDLCLAIAKNDFDAVQLNVVFIDFELEPRELAIMAANMDHVVIDQEGDMTIGQPDPFGGMGRSG